MQKWIRLLACLVLLCLLPAAGAQQEYQLKPEITTVLLAGTDRRPGGQADPLDFRSGGQADFLMLLVLDGEAGTITPIHIDRDTITEITTLSVLGREAGSRRAQVCLAHSFGDGAARSADLLCRAVRNLMGGIPIDYYFTLSMYAVPDINDAIGGVELTLSEDDDFSAYDPEMTPGKTLALTGRQALIYTTRRYHVGDETNHSRQERQRRYIRAAAEKLTARAAESPSVLSDTIAALQRHACTNMGLQELAALAMTALNCEIRPIRTLSGAHRTGEDGFVEFIVDEQALPQLIREVFCKPAA